MKKPEFIPLTIGGDTAVLHLSSGKLAMIDFADWHLVGAYVWSAAKIGHTWYAQRSIYISRKFQRKVRLHRVLTNAPSGLDVDHDDGNGLNNRRRNLNVTTRQRNLLNWHRPHRSFSPTGFRGVYPHHDKFVSRISLSGKSKYLGLFGTKEDAARAFDRAAYKRYGSRAALNFPTELTHV